VAAHNGGYLAEGGCVEIENASTLALESSPHANKMIFYCFLAAHQSRSEAAVMAGEEGSLAMDIRLHPWLIALGIVRGE